MNSLQAGRTQKAATVTDGSGESSRHAGTAVRPTTFYSARNRPIAGLRTLGNLGSVYIEDLRMQ